jgi:hypothetical protein
MELKRLGNYYGVVHPKESVFAACDSNYFLAHAEPFVYSLDAIGKNVHIHVVNPTPQVLALAGLLYGTTKVDVGFTFEDVEFKDSTAEQRRTYYASVRFLAAPIFLPYFKKMLITDIDCVFNKPFDYPEEMLGYYPRESLPGTVGWEHEATKLAAGAVYYDHRAQDTAERVVQIFSQLPFIWFVDQMALNEAFKHWPKEVVRHFDDTFMDWTFKEDSIMWTGKGDLKNSNDVYLAKKAEYKLLREKLGSTKNIFLRPVLNIPFKTDKNRVSVVGAADTSPIRHHWRHLAHKLNKGGQKVNYVTRKGEEKTLNVEETLNVMTPQWMINEQMNSYFREDQNVFIPHHDHNTFSCKPRENVFYYMQTVFPWLFTIDQKGWGARGAFTSTFSTSRRYTDEAFNKMRDYVLTGASKFEQPANGYDSIKDEIGGDYIFVPLQIPHDKVIEFDSPILVHEFVIALCKWADEAPGRPKIVFKGHPVNPGSMSQIKEVIADYTNVMYVTDVDIHSMIDNAEATYVINSGTGQEAMLLDAKVVTFGRSEYDQVTIHGSIDDLDRAWIYVKNDNTEARKKLYRKWYDWYINDVTFDTTL